MDPPSAIMLSANGLRTGCAPNRNAVNVSFADGS